MAHTKHADDCPRRQIGSEPDHGDACSCGIRAHCHACGKAWSICAMEGVCPRVVGADAYMSSTSEKPSQNMGG